MPQNTDKEDLQFRAFPAFARKFKRNPKEYFLAQTSVLSNEKWKINEKSTTNLSCFTIVMNGDQDEGELKNENKIVETISFWLLRDLLNKVSHQDKQHNFRLSWKLH